MILTLAVGLAFCSSTPQAVYGLKVAYQKKNLGIDDNSKKSAGYIKFKEPCKDGIFDGDWQQGGDTPGGAGGAFVCLYALAGPKDNPAVYVGYVMQPCSDPDGFCREPTDDKKKTPTTIPGLPKPFEKQTAKKYDFEAKNMWYAHACGEAYKGCWVYDEDGEKGGEYYAGIVQVVKATEIDTLPFVPVGCRESGEPKLKPPLKQASAEEKFFPVTLPELIYNHQQTQYRWVQSQGELGVFQYKDDQGSDKGCLKFADSPSAEGVVSITVALTACGKDPEPCKQKPRSAKGTTTQVLYGGRIPMGTCMWYDAECGLKGCWIYGEGKCDDPEEGKYKAVIVAP